MQETMSLKYKPEQIIALMKCDDPQTQSRAANVISRCDGSGAGLIHYSS